MNYYQQWTTKDEIKFLKSLKDDLFLKLYPALRIRDWGEMDGKNIIKIADERYTTIRKKR